MDGTVAVLPDEKALVAQAVVETAAFAAIYDHYFPRVYTYVRYRVGDGATADDVTARVFERVLVHLGRYRPERAPFAAWLFAIARNAVLDHLRAQKRRRWLSLDALRDRAGAEPRPHDQAEIVVPYAFAYFIPVSTPHPEAALRWIDFLTREPPQLKGVPARRSVAESEPVRRTLGRDIGDGAYNACRKSIERAALVDYSLYYSAERVLGQVLLDVLEDGLEVETALSRAQGALEAPP